MATAAVSTWQAVRATRARDETQAALTLLAAEEREARDELATREAVQEFFLNTVFAAGRPVGRENGLGRDVTLRRAVEAAEPGIAAAFRDRPLVEVAVRMVLGETDRYLGETAASVGQFETARRRRTTALGPDHPDTLTSMNDLANSHV